MITLISHLNLVVSSIVIGLTLILIAAANLTDSLDSLNFKKSLNTALATSLWTVWWISLLVFYSAGDLLSHRDGLNLALLDIGNMCILGAALSLSKGKRLHTTPRSENEEIGNQTSKVWALAAVLLLLIVWDLALGTFSEQRISAKAIVIGPSMILSNVSIIMLGWIFLVRWGIYGLPFQLLTLAYALIQLPAYLAAFFGSMFNLSELATVVFLALGLLKIPYAFTFLAFLLSPQRPDFREAKYWPDKQFNQTSGSTLRLFPLPVCS